MLGFILTALGFLGVREALRGTSVERLSFQALVVDWIGTGLTVAFFGAETFGLRVIGQEALSRGTSAALSLADDVRTGPGLAVFVVGLVLVAIAAIMLAVAIWRSGVLPRWSGVPFALGFALYLPQFAATQPIRVAHGVLVAIGCVWISSRLVDQTARSSGRSVIGRNDG
jgi:hypothetical protein